MQNILFTIVALLLTPGFSTAEDKTDSVKAAQPGVDKSAIDEAISKKLENIRACYDPEAKRSPGGLSGSLFVNFNIGSTGKVVSATIDQSTLKNAAVESCLLGVIKGIDFPAPAGGGYVEVSYPFAFTDAKVEKSEKSNASKKIKKQK